MASQYLCFDLIKICIMNRGSASQGHANKGVIPANDTVSSRPSLSPLHSFLTFHIPPFPPQLFLFLPSFPMC